MSDLVDRGDSVPSGPVEPVPTAVSFADLPGARLHETHSGIVLLIGDLAYKLKKPADLGFLDFRTPEARWLACRRELDLNRRLAPDVYLDVSTFTRTGLTAAEPVLVMRRMPDDRRLSTLIADGADVDDDVRAIARRMAAFHSTAERGLTTAAAAGPEGLRRRWSDNLSQAQPYAGTVLDPAVLTRIRHAALRFVDGRTPLLTERANAGFAVDGHGDLITDDIFCLADGPRVLDCLEFDDALRRVDVLDDMAFLAMDLERLGRPDLADKLLAWYAEFSGVPVVESLRHHYIAYRAFVRAKVACIRAAQGVPEAAPEAQMFADLALRHLNAGEVRLVLVGGAPGTGKTTIATAVADQLGAALLSTDVIRQEQNWPVCARYSSETKAATYRALLDQARELLEHGQSVVADATWGERAWRLEADELAAATASTLIQLECEAPVDVAAARAEQRLQAGTDHSEAGADIARTLAIHRDPWLDATRLDTSGPPTDAISLGIKLACTTP
jgi:aminoglycoside phosphotransferase family enzyme/predicted kinase